MRPSPTTCATIPLPRYADPLANAEISLVALEDGTLQKEALEFFLAVIEIDDIDYLERTFNEISLRCEKRRFNRGYPDGTSLLYTTMALAALCDIGKIEPYISSGVVDAEEIRNHILKHAKGHPIDVLGLYLTKKNLSLHKFCSLFWVRPHDIAILAVFQDNLEAYRLVESEHPAAAFQALSSVAFKPATCIRRHIGNPVGEMSTEELHDRFIKWVSLLDDKHWEPLIDPDQPLQVAVGTDTRFIACPDDFLALGNIQGCHAQLLKRHERLLMEFGARARQCVAPRTEQLRLIEQVWQDFEAAGVCQADILVFGVMDQHGIDHSYNDLSREDKAQWLPHYALEQAAVAGTENPAALHQLNMLIRRLPRESLEAACTLTHHWEALYRATGDRTYLPKLKERVDRVMNEDLGL